MAIEQCMPVAFLVKLFEAEMNFKAGTGDVFRMALYDQTADLGPLTTAYTTASEITSAGYVAGGTTLTISQTPTAEGLTAYVSFNDAVWASNTISARGAMVYKQGNGNPVVAVLDFGEIASSAGGEFRVSMPTIDRVNAILRLG